MPLQIGLQRVARVELVRHSPVQHVGVIAPLHQHLDDRSARVEVEDRRAPDETEIRDHRLLEASRRLTAVATNMRLTLTPDHLAGSRVLRSELAAGEVLDAVAGSHCTSLHLAPDGA